MSDLLPFNATKPERAMANTIARMSAVPVPVRELWSPQTCPAAVLPWLAFALSVDNWNATWTEQQKRDSIAASIEVHKRKGTIGAVRSAIMALGYDGVQVIENAGQIFVFKLRVIPGPDGVPSEAALDKLEDVAIRAKNERSHLEKIEVLLEDDTTEYIGAALTDSLGVDMLDELQENTGPQFIEDAPDVSEFLVGHAIAAGTCAGMAVDIDDTTPLTWLKTSGPAWLTVASNGALGGTPPSEDTFSVTVQATDADSASSTKTFKIYGLAPLGGPWGGPYIGGDDGMPPNVITRNPGTPLDCVQLAAMISPDYRAYALRENGALVTWPLPAPAGMPTTGVASIVAEKYDMLNYASIAVKTDGTVAAWGAGAVITGLPALSDVTQVVTNGIVAMAVHVDGTVTAWGTDSNGFFAACAALTNVKQLALGQVHVVVLKNDGSVSMFGGAGAGNTIPAGLVAKAVAAGREHSVAIRASDGVVVCWGNNYWNACNIPANTVATAISAASTKTVVVTPDGKLVTAGTQTVENEISQIVAFAAGKRIIGAFVNNKNQSGLIWK